LVLKDKGSLGNIKKNKDVELPLWTNYLADNVLAVLPSDTQEFLLKTSVLKTMSADLCEAVTGYSNCQSIL
jgi:ATP/maltotriose-dependent transcriptional regulator MalT